MTRSRRWLVVFALPACVITLTAAILLLFRPSRAPEREQVRDVGTVSAGQDESRRIAAPPASDLSRPKKLAFLAPAFDESKGIVQRMKAVEAVPRAQAQDTLAALRWLLRKRGENEGLRNIVANKLRECGEEHLVSDLTKMLWNEEETPKWRNYCVQQLYICYGQEPDPAIVDTLLRGAGCEETLVRICAIWSLSLIASEPPSSPELVSKARELALAGLRDEKAHFLIRTAGVHSCAQLELREALPGIRELAGSDDTKPTSLRVAAAAALGDLKDAESTPVLERLAKTASGQLQAAARIALRKIRGTEGTGDGGGE